MAVIQTKDPDVHAIGHDGVEYQTQGDGLFEVPQDVAAQLVKNAPHSIRLWDGLPWPKEKTPEEVEAERIAGLVRSAMEANQGQQAAAVDEPRPRLKVVAAKKSTPKKKSPAKKKAAKAAAAPETAAAPKKASKKQAEEVSGAE